VTGWAIYSRVSTAEQAEDGISLDAQVAACRAALAARGLTLAHEYQDAGRSGRDLDRPGIAQALADAEAGLIAGLIVWRLDRLTRSVRDLAGILESVENRGFGLMSVTESIDTASPIGRFVLHLLGAVAQWEREVIGERTRVAMAQMRDQGLWTGGPIPPGCAVVGQPGNRRLVAGPDAQRLRLAWDLILQGRSLIQACADLDAAGIPPPAGRGPDAGQHWRPAALLRLLRAERVIGILVDAETHARVAAELSARPAPGRAERVRRHPRPGASPWSGILRCGLCGRALVQVSSRRWRYWRCSGRAKGSCQAPEIPMQQGEDAAALAVAAALAGDASPYRQELERCLIADADAGAAAAAQLPGLRSQRAGTLARIGEIARAGSSGPALAAALAALDADLRQVDARISQAEAAEAAAAGGAEMVAESLAAAEAAMAADPVALGEALRGLLWGVLCRPDGSAEVAFRPGAPPARGGGDSVQKARNGVPGGMAYGVPGRRIVVRVRWLGDQGARPAA